MSFLFKDDVLTKLLVESGVFDSLSKYGQQVNNDAKLVATKLTKQLMEQAADQSGANDMQVYVQNLVDLDSYLNFLNKNNIRDNDGKIIVYHDTSGASPPADVENYIPYKEFYVLKTAFLEKLHDLDVAANQVGNEVMKPLVKGLVEQVNSVLGLKYESQADQARKANEQQSQNGVADNNQSGMPHGGQSGQMKGQNVNFNPNDPNAKMKNISDQSNDFNESLQQLKNVLPFESDDALSPYAMHMFIGNAAKFASDLPANLQDNRMSLELSQLYGSMGNSYTEWNSFVDSIHKNPNSAGGANAASYKTEVPYSRGNRPFSTLESIFGSQFKAKEATQRLLQMVLLVQQTIAALKRSPQLKQVMGTDVLDYQLRQARAFVDSLTAYAR